MSEEIGGKRDFRRLAENLRTAGYIVHCFRNAAEASAYLDERIDGRTVGFAGSMTLEEMGLYDRLSAHNRVYWHHRIPAGSTDRDERAAARTASVYITSVNAVAETGEIVNIDGTGNRVASMCYGHEKVYFVIGQNKVTADYESAVYRARNTAAPRNAKRLNAATPCAREGNRCYDCRSPARICRVLSVLWSKPISGDCEVLLIGEDLGY